MRKIWAVFLILASSAQAVELAIGWDANPPEEQVVGYRVWDGAARICETTATQCVSDLAIGTHSLTVTAVNAYGLESERSAPLIVALAKPSVVQRVNVTVTTKVTVGGP